MPETQILHMILVARRPIGLGLALAAYLLLSPAPGLTQVVNNAQPSLPGSIQGKVTFLDQGKVSPLPGVSVRLSATAQGIPSSSTTTDVDGDFQFTGLPADTYTLELSMESFQTQTETVVLASGAAVIREFGLHLSTVNQTVEVRAAAGTIPTEDANTGTTVTSQQIVSLPIAQQTVTAALPLIPSVVRTSDGSLNMKGASENQGMLLVDSAETVDIVTGSFSIPISVDAIQSMSVSETAYTAEFGGFSGGLTEIHTKPPSDVWRFGLNDFLPGFRGKNGHLRGVQDEEPRLYLTGPVRKGKLNFSEAITYQFMRPPVRGLAWPFNETKTQGAGALTNVQAILSPRHLLNVNLNLFFQRVQFANINALVPQTASSNDGQDGFSIGATDTYQFVSGMALSTVFQYTRFNSNAGGQGSADMLLTPDGWGGNYFNSWQRSSGQFQVLPTLLWAPKNWYGRHELKIGVAVTRRSYSGVTQSHPVQLLREDGSLAEQIDFSGTGRTSGTDTEISEFIQDHWTLRDRLSVDLGARLLSQTAGSPAAFAPRVGVAYSPGSGHKTVIHAGAGVFDDRVPLLATDFPLNLTRVVSYFDTSGQLAGPPVSFQNVFLQRAPGVGFAIASDDLDAVAHNFTWNLEVDRELRHGLDLSGQLPAKLNTRSPGHPSYSGQIRRILTPWIG